MKNSQPGNDQMDSIRNPKVTYDPSLDKYDGVVLFPKKLDRAKEMFERVGLPDFIEQKPLKKP